MAFEAIEWFAFVFAIFILIKGIVVLINSKAWIKFAKGIWSKPWITGFVSLILAVIVLYYLLGELTIIQIFAVMLFTSLLLAVSIATLAKEFISMADKLSKRKIKGMWLPLLIWLILLVWVLYELFL